jgi:hypothetical protein
MKILAADLWPSGYPERTYGEATNHELVHGKARLHQLIENVLLYDQVVVPTDNLLSFQFLARAFGPETLAVLLDAEVLKFRRFIGTPIYAGGGVGLTVVKVDVPASLKANASVRPSWLPTGLAATAILSELPGVSLRRAKQIAAKIVHATQETDLDSIRIEMRNRTFASALSSEIEPSLKISGGNLDDLGLESNKLKTAGSLEDFTPGDDVDRLMLIARVQLELIAKQLSACDDVSTLAPIGKVLHAHRTKETSMDRLCRISQVPDIGTAVMQGAISIEEVIKLRESKHWREFVEWFHYTCAREPDRVAREYVKLLKLPSLMDTPFFRTVRFFISTLAGLANPIAGIATAAADAFLIPKLREPSAKYFIEKLEQLARDQISSNEQN